MSQQDKDFVIATHFYNMVERGRGEFRSFSSVGHELQARYLMLAREAMRIAEFNRQVRTKVTYDDTFKTHTKVYEDLMIPPPSWVSHAK